MKHKALIPFLICFLPYFELAHGESAKNREKFLESTGMYLAAIDMMERMQNSRCAYLFEEKKYSLNSTLDEVMPLLDLSEKRDLFGVISSGKLEENKTILDSFFESASKNSLDEKTSCGLVVGAFAGVYKQNINNWKDLLAEQVVTQNKVPPLSLIAEPSLNTLGFEWFEGDEIAVTGKGKYVWASGDVYEGDWVNGERTGQGKHTSTSGEVHEGVWSEGNIVVTEKNRQKNCKPLTDLLTSFDARTRKMFDPKAIKQDRWSAMLGGIANTRPMGSPMGSGASAARNFDAKLERAITARESRRIEIVMKISDAGC